MAVIANTVDLVSQCLQWLLELGIGTFELRIVSEILHGVSFVLLLGCLN